MDDLCRSDILRGGVGPPDANSGDSEIELHKLMSWRDEAK